MYKTTCPVCGGDLFVVEAKIYLNTRLEPHGFDIMDSKVLDTDDEVVRCGKCNRTFKLSELVIQNNTYY